MLSDQLAQEDFSRAKRKGFWRQVNAWLTGKSNCAAYLLSKDYENGSPLRQEILGTALSWISNGAIEKYMSAHQHDPNANELWTHITGM